ncbi:MAG: serine O-acetyltransferase [Zetaproteobacteria bacterium]|nr:serine O-acetyltransferase [Zetaproteobacteria bacterium]
MFSMIRHDIRTVFDRDPAARSAWEVLTCYPGLHAIWMYRIAHVCWTHGFCWCGRWISHVARWLTGIEIHPGASIGKGFFIDHGMGVVIGETTEIGNDVTLYHGVTLGGTTWRKEKRHPTLEDGVIVGTGAKVLGAITIGAQSRIGANSVVLKDVPEHATVIGIPGTIVGKNEPVIENGRINLDHHQMPDPVAQVLTHVLTLMDDINERIDGFHPNEQGNNPHDAQVKRDISKEHQKLEDFLDGNGI